MPRSGHHPPTEGAARWGEGTGLGLSNAIRFAEEFGGGLELENAGEGAGATFVLRLPAAAPESRGEAAGVREA